LPSNGTGTQAPFAFTKAQAGVQIPNLTTAGGQYYRNRMGTVNIPIGNTAITGYMVAGAKGPSSTCCGTYGTMENTANSGLYPGGEFEGLMFAIAWATGTGGVPLPGKTGPWPGVDLEAGVYLYGPGPAATENFVTSLAKYSPPTGSNLFAVKGGDAAQNSLPSLFSSSPPPSSYQFSTNNNRPITGAWEGGLSLGEGGDGSHAPIEFFEGAIVANATSDAADNALQASLARFYGAAQCYGNNLVSQPANLSSTTWARWDSVGVTNVADFTGATNAAQITQTDGAAYSNVDQAVNVTGGTTYTFTDYIQATTNATVFPGGSVQTNDSSATEFAFTLNTNSGAIVAGTWGKGKASSLTAAAVGNNWWKVSMTFTAPAGSTSARVFIDPPTANASGVRSSSSTNTGLSATHYCPSVASSQ
jgi:non-reducing end alpha-L-arabinofuranosidase